MATTVSSRIAPDVPIEVTETLSGLALTAAAANVVMQLARLPVGHGVARSTVESGRIDRHPLKRTRTTLAYLMVALLGTEEQRGYMRREVDRQHRQVRSAPGDPVSYDAFDRDLQLWVAACLFRGVEDVHRLLYGEPDERTAEIVYQHASRLGTTLQVGEDQWPEDREAFQAYWDREVAAIEMDDLTREYLMGVAEARFFGPPFSWLVTPLTRFLTGGFLPPEFRAELGLPWNGRKQRRFEQVMGVVAAVNGVLPGPLRRFPLNVYWWDTRRRMAAGRPIV